MTKKTIIEEAILDLDALKNLAREQAKEECREVRRREVCRVGIRKDIVVFPHARSEGTCAQHEHAAAAKFVGVSECGRKREW
jgi:hypothetical protein